MDSSLRKKVIIHTGSLKVGGQEKMLSEFLKVLDPLKYEILLLIEEDWGKKNLYEELIPECIEYKFLTSRKFMERLENFKQKKTVINKILYSLMLKIKKKIAIKNLQEYLDFSDIIIDYNMGLLRYCNELNLKNKRLIGWSHAGIGQKLKHKKKHNNQKLYTDIVTINEEMKKNYLKNYSQYGIKIYKIHNFLDEKIIINNSLEKVQENLGKYIISVGSLTENKNHATLIKAFKKLVDKGINDNLVILGEGKEKNNLEILIRELNLENRVKMLGVRSNPYKYIKESVLFVQCSYSEGFPLVLLESMILGKAVISTENYGSREVLENGNYGLIVKNNIDEISDAINTLLKDEEKKKKYEKLSIERGKVFSLEAGQKTIEEFIDNL